MATREINDLYAQEDPKFRGMQNKTTIKTVTYQALTTCQAWTGQGSESGRPVLARSTAPSSPRGQWVTCPQLTRNMIEGYEAYSVGSDPMRQDSWTACFPALCTCSPKCNCANERERVSLHFSSENVVILTGGGEKQ